MGHLWVSHLGGGVALGGELLLPHVPHMAHGDGEGSVVATRGQALVKGSTQVVGTLSGVRGWCTWPDWGGHCQGGQG